MIEIPKGCKAKYELDKETGLLKLDRVLYTSTVYPANYGFIPRTLADDGDPLDVLVLCGETIYPMTLVTCYPIGMIKMVDGEEEDEKINAELATPEVSSNFAVLTEKCNRLQEVKTKLDSLYEEYETLI